LESRIYQLSLISEALWEIVSKKSGITESQLHLEIQTVITSRRERGCEKLSCSSCSMSVPANNDRCMYCGNELAGKTKGSPFDE